MERCWHCGAVDRKGKCDCAVCGKTALVAGVIANVEGPCQSCKGMAFNEQFRHILDRFDPRNTDNWERHPAADGNKGYRIYLPTKGIR